MGAVRTMVDSLRNYVSGLGTGRDKSSASQYGLVVLTDSELIAAYRGSWLARKVVSIPAFDAFRNWRSWQAEENIIGQIEAEEKRLAIQGKYMRAKVLARLFGGCALYMSVDDGADPADPLDLDSIKRGGLRSVSLLFRRQLTADENNMDIDSEWFGQPEHYTLTTGIGVESGRSSSTTGVVGTRIHASRLAIFKGEDVSDDELALAGLNQGWQDSVLVSTITAIKQADSTAGNLAALVFEAKVDVLKIPNFLDNIGDAEYRSRLMERHTLAAMAKGIHGQLLIDEGEEYETKQITFSTLPEVMQIFLIMVSGAADIPVTRLLGQSPAGMNATGESDLRNYYDRIKAIQEVEIRPTTWRLDEALIRSAVGSRPEDAHYIWSSLWQVSDKERAEIGKLFAEIINTLYSTNLFPPEALAKAGANMMVEGSVMPGLIEEIESAGGLPDYDLEAEQQREQEAARLEAATARRSGNVTPLRRAANDATLADAEPRTLYVRRDVLNAAAIVKHYRDQGVETMGPEKMHVTIIYSQKEVDWFAISSAWDSEIKLPKGGARASALFGPPGLENSLVLMFKSNELEWRNLSFREQGCSTDYEEYQPHVSIRYYDNPGDAPDPEAITPWIGEIVLGPEIYEEVKA